jgi:hypothetical protein
MRCAKHVVTVLLMLLSTLAAAGNFRREALVISMETVPCWGHRGVLAAIAGDGSPTVSMCSDYIVETDTVRYRIRSQKQLLLPVGEPVKFRFARNHILVRPDDTEQDYEFDVMSMELIPPGPKRLPDTRTHAASQ